MAISITGQQLMTYWPERVLKEYQHLLDKIQRRKIYFVKFVSRPVVYKQDKIVAQVLISTEGLSTYHFEGNY